MVGGGSFEEPPEILSPEQAAGMINAANMKLSDAYVLLTAVHIWILKLRQFQHQMGNVGSTEGQIALKAELQSTGIDQPFLDVMSMIGRLEEILSLFLTNDD